MMKFLVIFAAVWTLAESGEDLNEFSQDLKGKGCPIPENADKTLTNLKFRAYYSVSAYIAGQRAHEEYDCQADKLAGLWVKSPEYAWVQDEYSIHRREGYLVLYFTVWTGYYYDFSSNYKSKFWKQWRDLGVKIGQEAASKDLKLKVGCAAHAYEADVKTLRGSSVEHLHFNNTTNMLAAVGEERVSIVWPAIETEFIDRTLLQQSIIQKPVPALGKFPILRSFIDNVVSLSRSDGSIVTTTIPPFAEAFLKHTANSKWDQAIRLCRHIKSEVTSAILAGLATAAQNTYAAEIAYGALEEIIIFLGGKVQMLAARTHPNKEVRAMMVLLAGKVPEADNLLERGGNIYRAVMLNIIMMRWSRALDIALKHNAYLEVVMEYRQRYLDKLGREETDKNHPSKREEERGGKKSPEHTRVPYDAQIEKHFAGGDRLQSHSRGDGRSRSCGRSE